MAKVSQEAVENAEKYYWQCISFGNEGTYKLSRPTTGWDGSLDVYVPQTRQYVTDLGAFRSSLASEDYHKHYPGLFTHLDGLVTPDWEHAFSPLRDKGIPGESVVDYAVTDMACFLSMTFGPSVKTCYDQHVKTGACFRVKDSVKSLLATVILKSRACPYRSVSSKVRADFRGFLAFTGLPEEVCADLIRMRLPEGATYYETYAFLREVCDKASYQANLLGGMLVK